MWSPEVKSLFFDFDGTLVNSLPVLRRVYHTFLEKVGRKGSENEFQHLNGPNIREIISYLKETYKLSDTHEAMEEMFHHLFVGLYTKEVELFPGVKDFLQTAKEKKLSLWVVTSANPTIVELVLKKTGISSYIDGIMSSLKLTNGKPHPEVYLEALKKAGRSSQEVIAFEDSEKGILSSEGAGIKTFRVDNGHHFWVKMTHEFF